MATVRNPRKSTAQSNSRKRLSSQTEEQSKTQEESEIPVEETNSTNEPQKNDDDQTNSSLNSEEVDDSEDVDDSEVETEAVKETKPVTKKKEKATKNDSKHHGAEPKGHIVRLGEELNVPATKHENFAVVDKDVYREVQLRGSKRIAYQLVYTAGTAIPLSKLNQIK